MLYEKYDDRYVTFPLKIKVVRADDYIIAEGPFDLAKNIDVHKKDVDIIISLDCLGRQHSQ